MREDPIVKHIHKVRQRIARRFDNDLQAICKDAETRQGRNGRKVVQATPKSLSGKPQGESAA